MLDGLLHWAYSLPEAFGGQTETLDTLRILLIHGYVPAMASLLGLTAAALLLSRGALGQRLGAVSLRAWLALLVIFNAALAIRLFWTPHMPQVYFDEISFLNTADNMARSGLNALSSREAPPGQAFHQCPAGWQYLISLAWRACGIRPEVAFNLASVLSAASVVLIFLVLWEMTESARTGLWGALFLAVLPVHVRLGGCTALETASLFFLLATVYAMHVWRATGARGVLLLTACLGAWFVNTRMENSFALGPLLLVYFFLLGRPGAARGSRLVLLGCALLLAAYSLPAVMADCYGVLTRFYFFYQPAEVTRADIVSNLQYNIPYWFDDGFHPLLFTLLALMGVGAAFLQDARHRTLALFWLLWTVALIAFYTMNPSCDFSLRHTLDSWRTALHPALGIVLLAAMGADGIIRTLQSATLRRVVMAALLATTVLIPWLFRDFVQQRTIWMAQWEILCRMRDRLPPDARLLVYDNTSILSPSSPGLSYEIAMTTGVVPHFFIFPGTWDYQSEAPPPQVLRFIEGLTVEKRKLFLYHLDMGAAEDAHQLSQMQSLFQLTPVARASLRKYHATFSLWRVVGPAARVAAHRSDMKGIDQPARDDDQKGVRFPDRRAGNFWR